MPLHYHAVTFVHETYSNLSCAIDVTGSFASLASATLYANGMRHMRELLTNDDKTNVGARWELASISAVQCSLPDSECGPSNVDRLTNVMQHISA